MDQFPDARAYLRRCGQRRGASLDTSTAKLHDARVWDDLLHGAETSVRADKGFDSAEREAAFKGPGKAWGMMRKAPKGSPLDPLDVQIKRQFGPVKTRYRGLARNRAQLFTLFALGTLFLVRKILTAGGQACSKIGRPPQKWPKAAKSEPFPRTGRRRKAQAAIPAKPKAMIRSTALSIDLFPGA